MFIKFSPTALKKVFAQNKEIQEMAQNNFIMLNLMVHDLYNVFVMMKVHKKRKQARDFQRVLTSVRNNGKRGSMIITFKEQVKLKRMSPISLEYILQRKGEENVFKIFTEQIFPRTHHKFASPNLKISIPINCYSYFWQPGQRQEFKYVKLCARPVPPLL